MIRFFVPRIVIFILAAGALAPAPAADSRFDIPQTSGIAVEPGDTIPIPGATSAILHQFEDGRIVLFGGDKGIWSEDAGRTWKAGPAGPDDKVTMNLGNGGVLSVARTTVLHKDGNYRLPQRRSADNWKTFQQEEAVVLTPQATSCGGDDGSMHDGMMFHHGLVRLKNGDLMASLYGNYQGDNDLADGYPVEFNMRKYRTVVIFSSDEGKTWRNPITVGYDKMLARGLDDDSSVDTTIIVPALTQEGFGEADLVRAANGDIICAMRSGGRIGVPSAPIFPTPLYMSRSSDEGKTWTAPVPAADRGCCPYLVTLENGIIVCAYARPGSWLIFSDDNGKSWKGAFEVGPSDSYCNVVATGPDEIMCFYRGDSGPTEVKSELVGTLFKVRRK